MSEAPQLPCAFRLPAIFACAAAIGGLMWAVSEAHTAGESVISIVGSISTAGIAIFSATIANRILKIEKKRESRQRTLMAFEIARKLSDPEGLLHRRVSEDYSAEISQLNKIFYRLGDEEIIIGDNPGPLIALARMEGEWDQFAQAIFSSSENPVKHLDHVQRIISSTMNSIRTETSTEAFIAFGSNLGVEIPKVQQSRESMLSDLPRALDALSEIRDAAYRWIERESA